MEAKSRTICWLGVATIITERGIKMLDGSHYIECACGSDEHTIRFVLDKKDKEIYMSVFLNQYRNIFQRIWVAIKYVFGYKCRYGHWDCTTLWEEQIDQLQQMIDDFKNSNTVGTTGSASGRAVQ